MNEKGTSRTRAIITNINTEVQGGNNLLEIGNDGEENERIYSKELEKDMDFNKEEKVKI